MFLSENISHPYIYQLIYDAFDKFFYYQVSRYTGFKEHPLSCTGSVGYHYKEIFLKVAEKQQIKVSEISKTPMQGLIKYHREG
jgi:hypothetical protein